MTDVYPRPHQFTFTAVKDADPIRYRASCVRGALAAVASRDRPKPPRWLLDMDAAEFLKYLEEQEAQP